MTSLFALLKGSTVVLLAAALAGGTAAAQPVDISGFSSNPDGGDPTNALAVTACNGAPQSGVVYRNSEVEPTLAVNPVNPDNMIAGWHQDRWSTGGGQSLGAAFTQDGGASWSPVIMPFTRCSGGGGTKAGDYERASDPWISFSPDGTAHYMALVFDDSVSANGMAVSNSSDGGVTWSRPVIIKRSPAQDPVLRSLFHDKNTLTADPHDPNLVYATWTLFRTGNTSLLFARSSDGGTTWSSSRPIGGIRTDVPAEHVVFRQGAQVVVMPDGTLLNFFYRILFSPKTVRVATEQATFRSKDQGRHWERLDFVVSDFSETFAFDLELGIPVRDAGPLPDVAVNRTDGTLYTVYQNANSVGAGVVISRSTDGGLTWSAPVPANPGAGANVGTEQAFLPSVAVNDAGQVGVMFYDFRNDVLGDDPLSTDVRVTVFSPDLSSFSEQTLTLTPMDLRQSVLTGGRGYFPGDYMGLETAGADFVAAFTLNNDLGLPVEFPQPSEGVFVDDNNRTNIVFARVTP